MVSTLFLNSCLHITGAVLRSAPINLENIGVVHLRLPSEENENEILKANVEVDGSTIFVSFSKSDIWPFQIENQSEHAVSLTQKVLKLLDGHHYQNEFFTRTLVA